MRQLLLVLETIKFEHTLFALPFAFLGAFLGAGGPPQWETCLWIILAMVGARTAAMSFNRLVDREDDALNPRTAQRALPQGTLSPIFVGLFTFSSSLVFLVAAWMLNPLAFVLSPLALAVILAYSYTKRFTSLSHLVLGLSLAIAPIGGWVAVREELSGAPFLLAAAVFFWVGGFDIIYSCQDYQFDLQAGRYSLPRRLGIKRALQAAAGFHVLMVILLGLSFFYSHLSMLSWVGLAVTAVALIYEHRLVSPNDLSRLNAAFFTVNGVISVVLFLFVAGDLCW